MECPNCSAEGPDGAAECKSCGLILAKHKERVEREKRALDETLARAAEPKKPFNPWRARVVSLALTLLWLIGFGLYYRAQVYDTFRRHPPQPPRTPAR